MLMDLVIFLIIFATLALGTAGLLLIKSHKDDLIKLLNQLCTIRCLTKLNLATD